MLDLLRGFRHEYKLTVATGERGFLTEEAAKLGVSVEILPNLVQPLQPLRDLRAVKETSQLIRRIRPDLVHCHTSKAGIIGRMAARLTSTPAVFTAHTWSFADGTSKSWKLVGTPSERIAANWTSKILAVSDSNRNLAIDRRVASPDKIVTVHNGIEDTLPSSADRQRVCSPYCHGGTIRTAEKSISVDRGRVGNRSSFKLTFIGDGPTRAAAESLTAERGLQDRVEFLGVRKDTTRFLPRAAFSCWPQTGRISHYDSGGYARGASGDCNRRGRCP